MSSASHRQEGAVCEEIADEAVGDRMWDKSNSASVCEDYFGIIYEEKSGGMSDGNTLEPTSQNVKQDNLFDEQYFTHESDKQSIDHMQNSFNETGGYSSWNTNRVRSTKSSLTNTTRNKENLTINLEKQSVGRTKLQNSDVPKKSNVFDEQYFPHIEEDTEETEVHNPVTKREIKSRNRVVPNLVEPKTAYDVAMKLKKEQKKQEYEGVVFHNNRI